MSEESGSGLHREAETAFGSNESYRGLVVTDVKRSMDRSPSRPRHRSCSEDRVDRLEFGCSEPPTGCRSVVLQKASDSDARMDELQRRAHVLCECVRQQGYVRAVTVTDRVACSEQTAEPLSGSETPAAITLRRLRPTSASVRDAASAAMAACLSGPT